MGTKTKGGRFQVNKKKEVEMNTSFILNYQVHVSLAFYMLLIFLNSCQKTCKMICESNFMVLNHFWTFWRKNFSWFLTSEISEICDSGSSKSFNSLNFRLARKNFGMLDTYSIFFPYVGNIYLSNAPTLMSIRHLEKKWALKNWNYPRYL